LTKLTLQDSVKNGNFLVSRYTIRMVLITSMEGAALDYKLGLEGVSTTDSHVWLDQLHYLHKDLVITTDQNGHVFVYTRHIFMITLVLDNIFIMYHHILSLDLKCTC